VKHGKDMNAMVLNAIEDVVRESMHDYPTHTPVDFGKCVWM